jgi:cell division protein FtsQ
MIGRRRSARSASSNAVEASVGSGRSGTALIEVTDDDVDEVDERPVRRRWPFRLALALVIAILLGTTYVVGFSPLLALRSVVVTGSGAASLSDQVRAAVAVADGTPLALVDLAEVHDRVAAVGPVASVTVQRQWPHTLVVTVTARAAVAVAQADGRWWLLDATGKPYQPIAQPPATLMKLELATPGEGDRATLAALGILGSLPPAMRRTVASISAPSTYAITLNLADGRRVLWGSDTQNALKVAVLPALLARPGKAFDISDPTLVTVR